jgi:endonuclease G, mitochondrial
MTRRAIHALTVLAAALASLDTHAGGAALPFGAPQALVADERWATQVLQNPGFTVGYSDSRRQALWVAYRAGSVRGRKLGPRPRHFSVDARVAAKVTSQHYNGSGFDRGHLAPNYLIGKLYGAAAQRATFLMTNISPQKPRLNELVWQRLEEAEVDDVAPHAGALWVVSGPLFGAGSPILRSGVAVPDAFYRIWLDAAAESARPRMLAFIVPQDVCGTEPLSTYLASVDEVERRAGLDFFGGLENAFEAALEGTVATEGWRVKGYDRRPPRYAENFAGLQC